MRLQERVEKTKLKWYGRIIIMKEEIVQRKVFSERLTGRFRKGWADTVRECIDKRRENPKDVLEERKGSSDSQPDPGSRKRGMKKESNKR